MWGGELVRAKKRPRGVLGSNRPNSPRNLEYKAFPNYLGGFQSIWTDSETLIFRQFEKPGSLSTFCRESDLGKPKLGPEDQKLGSEKFDFGPRFLNDFRGIRNFEVDFLDVRGSKKCTEMSFLDS